MARTQDWTDRRVWIVGASSGIGRATAELLLQRGATVGISARSADKLEQLAAQYPRAIVLPVDTHNLEQLKEAYHRLTECGALDVYLHCAADYQPMRAWELDPTRMQQMMDTNYGGVLNGLSVVLPDMLTRQAGHLAIVASVAGYMGLPKSLAYGPTKAALINLCESLYVDLKPKGIGVQVINPGFVETPLTAQNDFAMPALLTPVQAATALVNDLATDQFEITFPKRFTYMLKFVKRLPYPIQLQILSKIAQNS
jgi:short-subunit dehydrogenase